MPIENIAIDASRMLILIFMFTIGAFSIHLSTLLNKCIRPLSDKLANLIQSGPHGSNLNGQLTLWRNHYENLLKSVDNIDSAEFSAGHIETLDIEIIGRRITAATAQSWVRQAPSILISLGLLGTFAGLTVGLKQIGGILDKSLGPNEAMQALSALLKPMSTAFETSLVGLLLSIIVLIYTQINGTRTCLGRCESLLSSWLETVVPQEIDSKVMSPLRQSLNKLNSTLVLLPAQVADKVQKGIQDAFAAKLDEIFNTHSQLAEVATSAVSSLSVYANALNESGQDFLEAAQAFRESSFATTLSEAAHSLYESREQLTSSTDMLSNRLFEVRDSLLTTQAEWRLVAKVAEQELEASRIIREQFPDAIHVLRNASDNLLEGTSATKESAKQLREARLEVMRDRKLALEMAEAVKLRLATDSSTVESCQSFAFALESALVNWNSNVNQLNQLSTSFITAVTSSKVEEDAKIMERAHAVVELMNQLQEQMRKDVELSISKQREAISSLEAPTSSAYAVSSSLLKQLEDLQMSISRISDKIDFSRDDVSPRE